MREVKFKSSISVLSLLAAIGFSSVALADGLSGGVNVGNSYIGVALGTGDASGADVSAIKYSGASSVVDIMGGATNEGNANKNNVTLKETTLSGQVSGGYSELGNTDNNIVTLTNSQIGGDVNGGLAFTGNATSNTVTMTDGEITGSVFGGYVDAKGAASQNSVTISGTAVVNGFVYGGYTEAGAATGNQLIVQGGSLTNAYGGRSGSGDASDNKVIISAGQFSASVYGGQAGTKGAAQDNIITMTGGSIQGEVIGGLSNQGKADNNIVSLSGGTVGTNAIGGSGSGDGASASGNKVSISDTAVVEKIVAGGYVGAGSGAVTSNKVNVIGGSVNQQVFGGKSQDGAATDNAVTISSGVVAGNTYGGYSDGKGLVQNNSIVITNGTINSKAYGGFAKTGDAIDNTITVSGGAISGDAIGGYSDAGGKVTGNSVLVSGAAAVDGFVIGGYSPTGDATNNSVSIDGGTVGLQAYGGRSTSGNVSGNTVAMTDGSVLGNVYGAAADGVGTATDNSVTITGGSLGNDVSGAWSQTGEASGNKVSISNATVARNVGGGYVENGGSDALSNSVRLSNSAHVKGYVFGGFTVSGSANNNSITLENVAVDNTAVTGSEAVDGAIYGGYTRAGDATGNTITLNGENITLGGAIYGGFDASGTGNAFTGNTLNLNAYRGSVSGIYNVENYNWLLPKNVAANEDALIHITGTDAVELDNTKHTVALYNDGLVLNAGDKIYLIDKAIGTPTLTTTSVQQGQFLVYDMTMKVEGDDLVLTVGTKDDKTPTDTGGSNGSTGTGGSDGSTSNGGSNESTSTGGSTGSVLPNMPFIPNVPSQRGVNINPRTKAFSEGRVASLGFTAQGSDLIATSIVNIREQVVQSDKIGFVPFLLTEGSSQTYKTGSSVDVKGFNMAAGLAARHEFEAGHQLTAGAFFEYGQGTYDTFNSFTNYASVRGDGNTHYTGGGVLGRIDIAGTGLGNVATLAPSQADGLYIEASLRAGRVKNKYDASNLVDAEGYRGQYDSSVTYFGAHGAVGYVFNFDEKQSLDAYGRYLYTHMGSDTVTIGKDRLNFDSSTSSRIQIGGRYSYQYNEQIKPFVGAAYEYEAKGDASATAYNMKLAKPSLDGSTGIFEAGVSFKPLEAYKNIGVDVKGRGFAGERKGGGGNIKLTAEF